MLNSAQVKNVVSLNITGWWDRIVIALQTDKTKTIAEIANITPSSISQWKSWANDPESQKLPSIESLFRIAKFSGHSIEWLLTGEENKGIKKPTLVPITNGHSEFGEREREIVNRLGQEHGLTFAQEVRELVLEALIARGEVLNKPEPMIYQEIHAEVVMVPLLGKIAAGKPIEPIEVREYLPLPRIWPKNSEVFLLEVVGDSMIEDGIEEGSLIVVLQRSTAENGEIVVAEIEGDGVTVKRFYRDNGKVRLEPRNQEYKPQIYPAGKVEIKGVVWAILKRP